MKICQLYQLAYCSEIATRHFSGTSRIILSEFSLQVLAKIWPQNKVNPLLVKHQRSTGERVRVCLWPKYLTTRCWLLQYIHTLLLHSASCYCKRKQESPPAWTQEAYRPSRSKRMLCCSSGGGGGTYPRQGGTYLLGGGTYLPGGAVPTFWVGGTYPRWGGTYPRWEGYLPWQGVPT